MLMVPMHCKTSDRHRQFFDAETQRGLREQIAEAGWKVLNEEVRVNGVTHYLNLCPDCAKGDGTPNNSEAQ